MHPDSLSLVARWEQCERASAFRPSFCGFLEISGWLQCETQHSSRLPLGYQTIIYSTSQMGAFVPIGKLAKQCPPTGDSRFPIRKKKKTYLGEGGKKTLTKR